MTKVRIRSGNQAGAVVEMSDTEAQTNVDTGFAEYVAPETAVTPAAPPSPAPSRGRRRAPGDGEGEDKD